MVYNILTKIKDAQKVKEQHKTKQWEAMIFDVFISIFNIFKSY